MHAGQDAYSGLPIIRYIEVDKLVDKASPALLLACCSGRVIPEASIVTRKAGGQFLAYFKVFLENVRVASFKQQGEINDARLDWLPLYTNSATKKG